MVLYLWMSMVIYLYLYVYDEAPLGSIHTTGR